MLEKDALLSKISIIKNCRRSIERATNFDPAKLDDHLVQDVFVLNLQRSVQACIDIANILIAKNNWKLPASYKAAFQILHAENVIEKELAEKLMKMCGFRNIAVHDYQEITPEILKSIFVHHLNDFEEFYSVLIDKKYL